MIKGLFFARRKPGLSPREFQEYWRTTHADITRPLIHIRHYIQSHTLLSSYGNPELPYGGGDPAYDGMATMWFNSIEERRAGQRAPAGPDRDRRPGQLHRTQRAPLSPHQRSDPEGRRGRSRQRPPDRTVPAANPGMSVEAFQNVLARASWTACVQGSWPAPLRSRPSPCQALWLARRAAMRRRRGGVVRQPGRPAAQHANPGGQGGARR